MCHKKTLIRFLLKANFKIQMKLIFKLIQSEMRNIIFLRTNIFLAIITLISNVLIFSACHKSIEPTLPVIPKVSASYAIHGIVTDMNNKEVSDAVIKVKGTASANATTNNNGAFEIRPLTKKGVYIVEVSKPGYMTTVLSVSLNSTLQDVTIKLPNQVEKIVAKATETTSLILPATSNTINTPVKLEIVAGALSKDTEIAVTEVSDIPTTLSSNLNNNNIPLIVLNYGPDGTTFAEPCSLAIADPLDDYLLEGVKLQWYNPSTKQWEDHPQKVTFENNSYITTINHFSSYKITGFSEGQSTKSTEDMLTLKYDNLNGRKDITVDNIPYTYKRGTIYVTTPEAAAASAGVSNKKVIDFIRTAVYATNTFTDVDTNYPVNVSIPAGVRMDVKGTQDFTTTSYTFSFKKNNKSVLINLITKAAGPVSVSTLLYSKEHTGGSGSN